MLRTTMAELAWADPQFRDEFIERVKRESESYAIKMRDGWSVSLFDEDNPNQLVPKEGDIIRLWDRGIGWMIRGMAINGNLMWWKEDRDIGW